MNNAELDPYLDRPIPNQQPLNLPRQDDEHDWELDGQEYQPSPYIEPDTRTGFDEAGNYHFDIRPDIPYRIAQEIADFVIRQASMSDHDISLSERDEIASGYILHLIDQNAFTDDMVAFQALQIWRVQNGRRRNEQ